jgi:hypothetical protein
VGNKQEKKTESRVSQSEPTYSRAEIMAAASSFGVKPEVIAGALRLVKKDRLTKNEIHEAIEQFKKRKVK